MGYENPYAILIDKDSNPLSVQNATAIPALTPSIIISGSDGTDSRYLSLDTSGRVIMVGAGTAGTPAGGIVSIQGVTGGQSVIISQATASNLRTQTASESTTGTATGTIANLIGGSVTTAVPSYTTGQMSALSLTTTGLLRVDGSNTTQPISGTVTANIGTSGSLALDASITALSLIDNSTFTDGTTKVQSIGFIFDEVAGTALTENDVGAARIDSKRAQILVIEDATTRGTRTTVKAASTAAVATDTALVVAISPNNPLTTTSSDVTATGALGALNAAVTITMPGKSTIGFQLATGTLIGTIVAEFSLDGGTTWNSTYFDQTTGSKVSSVSFASANTALASTLVGIGGSGMARVRVSTYTSGTANITLRASNVSDPSSLTGGIAGSALPPLMSQMGGSVTTAAPTYTSGTLNAFSLTTAGLLRVDASGTNQGVTITAPLPAGTNTIGNVNLNGLGFPFLVTGNLAAGSATAGNPVLIGASDGTDIRYISSDSTGKLNVNSIDADTLTASSYPDQGNYYTGATTTPTIDAFDNLQIRGTVLTDEGSFRDDFSGTALTTAITGNLTFTIGSVTITGTNLQTQLRSGQYIKKTADPETAYVQISSIDSNTSLTLVTPYAGAANGAAASQVSNWQTVTPAGGSIVVANSVATITAGTTANAIGSLRSLGDYLPYNVTIYATISQRIANQTIYFGFQDIVGTGATQQTIIQLTGTSNTVGNFVTSFSAAATDIQTSPFTYPNGTTSATQHSYKIDLSSNQATLSIDGIIVATNQLHLPAPYTSLFIDMGVINGATAPGSSTTIGIDNVFFQNIDRIQIDNDFLGEPLVVSNQDKQGNSSLAALNATSTINTGGYSNATISFSGTFVGTMFVQGQAGDGNWATLGMWEPNNSTIVVGVAVPLVAIAQIGGFSQIRVLMGAYTSGTANLAWNLSAGANVSEVFFTTASVATVVGASASGTAAVANPVLMAGYDGTNVQTLRTNSFAGFNALVTENLISDGVRGPVTVKAASTAAVATDLAIVVAISPNNAISVTTTDGIKASYSAAFVSLVPAATPTDIVTISGSATKTIRIVRISLTGTATSAAQRDVLLIKRSSANTGGTSTTATDVPHDSADAAGTSVVRGYTVNPTAVGTVVGTVRSRKVFVATTTTNSDEFIMDFGIRNDQALVLRGVAESFAINLNGITNAGNSYDISIDWTEE